MWLISNIFSHFLYVNNQFHKISHINKIICAKFPTPEIDLKCNIMIMGPADHGFHMI